jgi:small membrane protein
MTGIQLILIGGVAAIFLYYIFRLRNAFFDLLVTTLFFGLAIFFILSPNSTNRIAASLGVGRGADLLFYCCILFFFFAVLKLLARIRRLESKLTEIVRDQAKSNAQFMGPKAPDTMTSQEHTTD